MSVKTRSFGPVDSFSLNYVCYASISQSALAWVFCVGSRARTDTGDNRVDQFTDRKTGLVQAARTGWRFIRLAFIFSVILPMVPMTAHAEECSNVAFVNTLMPQPASITTASGCMNVDSTFSVSSVGYRDARLDAATNRMLDRLSRIAGVPHHLAISKETSASLVIDVKGQGNAAPAL